MGFNSAFKGLKLINTGLTITFSQSFCLHFDKNFDFVIIVELSLEASTTDTRDPDLGREMSL